MIGKILHYYRKIFWSNEKYARFRGVKIGQGCIISIPASGFGTEPYLIELGEGVRVTKNVKFFNHGGSRVFRKKYPDLDYFGKIKVGDNVYVGDSTIILPGVTIGDNVLIGAGSVITKSVPSNSVVGGNPAKVIRSLHELEEKVLLYNVKSKGLSYDEKRKLLLSLPDNMFIRK